MPRLSRSRKRRPFRRLQSLDDAGVTKTDDQIRREIDAAARRHRENRQALERALDPWHPSKRPPWIEP